MFLDTFTGKFARVRPVWSKGWAYMKNEGPWKDEDFIEHTRQTFSKHREDDDNWAWQVKTLEKYDKKRIFHSDFTDKLFGQ